MSDENDTPKGASEGPEATEEGASGSTERSDTESEPEQSTEQPDIGDDERADIPEDLAEAAAKAEEEAGASSSDEDDQEEDGDDDSDEETTGTSRASPTSSTSANRDPATTNWGDLYCDTLVTGLNAVVEEYGDEGADPIDESLPRDLDLDHYVDEWMAQQGKAEMEPGEGIVVGTTVLALTVLTTKTDLPSQALSRAQAASSE